MGFDSSKFLSKEEDELFQAMVKKYRNRNTLIFSLLRRYGMRTSELLNIRAKDLNHTERSLLIHGTKGSNDRELPLTADLYKRLAEEAKSCIDEDGKIFLIGRKRLHEIWHEYRPFKKNLHALRHTVGVELYKRTNNILLVKRVLGHKNVINTMIYLDFVQTQEEFRKALCG